MYLNIPTSSVTIQLEMEKIDINVMAHRKSLGLNISLNDLLIYAISKALEKHKEFNEGNKINIGSLVNFNNKSGEVIINKANTKEIKEIAKEFKEKVMELLRDKESVKTEARASVWVTNLHDFGAYFSIPPIKEGTKCMISLGASFEVLNKIKQAKPMANLTLSYDPKIEGCQKALLLLKEIKNVMEKIN